MMHTVSQRIQAYFGGCPNHAGIHAQTRDQMTGRINPVIVDSETPQPGTSPATVTVPLWMNAAALIILVATCFVGGNIWWPFFVGAVLLICLVYWYYCHIREVR